MALDKESNGYTIGFSAIMVVIVGALLTFIATSLKPYQDENIKNEKKQYILRSCGIDVSRKEAGKAFDQYIKKRIIIDYNGNIISEKEGEITKDDSDAFNIDILKEYKNIKDITKRNYPYFVCDKEGETLYVIPVVGKGLWSSIWGYICLKSDGKTVHGAVFDHKSETPGLGAEITKDFFSNQFKGKTIADENGNYTSIRVVKPGLELDEHKVDGISGGTFTSVGVDEMIKRSLEIYYNHFKKNI